MARFMRLDVANTLLEIGFLPLFYHGEVETTKGMISALARGGTRLVEFTNRGEMTYPVFTELVRHFSTAEPELILGVGSIIDAPTAALYLAAGANFIVGPSFNPEIARLSNRRKVLYIPGCGTEAEISQAEEWGAEVCKVFPGDVLKPAFIKASLGPSPWHRLMPTGGVEASEASIGEWIHAGAAAVGLGSKLISPQVLKEKDYDGVAARTAQCIGWVKSARENK
jgi:2-dehydro-3-deoxyphosphogluconate aldolase/(4S)-4-hydroxy-2-oxoglutarate aldolase